jgi:uncharacterized membrane protein YoaK (UPF0700 family)
VPPPARLRFGPYAVTAQDAQIVALTLTAGAVDAVSFLGLGHVFSSVITGNLVLLGVAAGTGTGALAVSCGTAVAGYCAGVLAGARIAARGADGPQGAGGDPRGAPRWPAGVQAALAAELGLLAVFTAGWELAGAAPHGAARPILLALLAVAMGGQSAAVRRLGQISTTYLTGTATGMLAGLVTGKRPGGLWRSLAALAAIVAGAACGGLLAVFAPAWAPAAIGVPIAAVVAAAGPAQWRHVVRMG